MRYPAIAIGFLIAILGTAAVVAPALPLALAESLLNQVGLYAVAGGRVLIGIVILLAAGISRAPITLRILGSFIIIAGLATPIIGVERSRALFEWWVGLGEGLMRATAGIVMLIGASLIYALLPRRLSAE